MTQLNELTAIQMREGLKAGKFSARDILSAALDRIDAREAEIGAWEHLDRTGALEAAGNQSAGDEDSLLGGVPFAVKDIIDVAGMPTRHGSPIYQNNIALRDAACVSQIKAAGAIIPGKTVTTEFAFLTPGKTANPHNPKHTPGGSSSGSAAAVADCQVPLAFGSQTAGSVIRPASYCGVYGFKPSQGLVNLAGVNPLAPLFDSLGFFARSVEDINLALAAQLQTNPVCEAQKPMRAGLLRPVEWPHASIDMQRAVEETVRNLSRAGIRVRDIPLERPFARANQAQMSMMFHDMRRSLAYEYDNHLSELSPGLRSALNTGQKVSYDEFMEALTLRASCQASITRIFETCEILIMPSAPGEAPLGLDATGDPIFNRLPTFLGVPAINLPGHKGSSGLPLGVQIVGPYMSDVQFLRIAAWLAPRITG